MSSVRFEVVGTPSPQAGTKPVPAGKGPDGKQRFRHVSTGGVNLKTWRTQVADAAREQAAQVGMLHGPVEVRVLFRFSMPKSRPKMLRTWGVGWMIGKPDADKLQRALGDSLKEGGLIEDDSRIVRWYVEKVEVTNTWTGAVVVVGQLLAPVDLSEWGTT